MPHRKTSSFRFLLVNICVKIKGEIYEQKPNILHYKNNDSRSLHIQIEKHYMESNHMENHYMENRYMENYYVDRSHMESHGIRPLYV